jgi:hypothetical protein
VLCLVPVAKQCSIRTSCSGDTGQHIAPDKISLGEWIEHWLAIGAPGRKKKRAGRRTLERYGQLLRGHLTPKLGTKRLQQLQPTDIENPDYFHKVVDCQWACPAHTPVPEYIRLIAARRFGDAWDVNWKSNVFPGILGRTCDRPCEPACRRGRVEANNQDAKPEPVAICRLKRVAADYKDDDGIKAAMPKAPDKNGKRIACIGAGPASLTVANDLVITSDALLTKPGMTIVPAAGWTSLVNDPTNGLSSEYRLDLPAAVASETLTTTVATRFSLVIAAFKPAGGGGASSVVFDPGFYYFNGSGFAGGGGICLNGGTLLARDVTLEFVNQAVALQQFQGAVNRRRSHVGFFFLGFLENFFHCQVALVM